MRFPAQQSLFEPSVGGVPDGFEYRSDFIDANEERALIDAIAPLPFVHARYQGYAARRRVVAFGAAAASVDDERTVDVPIPAPLARLQERAAIWLGVAVEEFVHILVTEYAPGTPLGWHRDQPRYEAVVGVSLASDCRMRFRALPGRDALPDSKDLKDKAGRAPVLSIDLEARSAYRITGHARWGWQHSIPPTPGLRYSVTLRTARQQRR